MPTSFAPNIESVMGGPRIMAVTSFLFFAARLRSHILEGGVVRNARTNSALIRQGFLKKPPKWHHP